jgi:hypothetical protein
MITNFREFEAGPDPFGRMWRVEFRWLQTAIAIRHADTVDVKFVVSNGDDWEERVIALRHTDLLELSRKAGRPLTDPWCSRLAAAHLVQMISTSQDMEKTIVAPKLEELEKYHQELEPKTAA